MSDVDEGDVPYPGQFCKCGLSASMGAWKCPNCGASFPEALTIRYPYDGGPPIMWRCPAKETTVAIDRLIELRNEIDRQVGEGQWSPLLAKWCKVLDSEIDEREKSPKTRDELILNLRGDLQAALHEDSTSKGARIPPNTLRKLKALELEMERLSIGNLPKADFATLIDLALDYRQENETDITPALAFRILSTLPKMYEMEGVKESLENIYGPWRKYLAENMTGWTRNTMFGDNVYVEPGEIGFVFFAGISKNGQGRAASVPEAMEAVDRSLSSRNKITLGGIPDEVKNRSEDPAVET